MADARWTRSKYGSDATFRVGDEPLGSIIFGKGGYTARGIFGSWTTPEPDRSVAKSRVVECARATLQSQLAAINKMLGR